MAHQSSLSGAWVLDTARSESLEDYLRCLGASENAIVIQATGERAHPSRNVIALDESRLVIYKNTAANNFTENFEIGEERIIESASGTVKRRKAMLGESGQLDSYIIVSKTHTAQGHSLVHVEARQLSVGGSIHTQELNVQNLVTGRQSVTTRFWVRVPTTALDLARLSPPER